MNYSGLQEFIKKYDKDDDFTGGVSEDKVKETELKLQVSLPESYKWFLKNYGSGGSFGIDIIGYDLVGASVVTASKGHQKYYGLIDGLVVIEDIDEFAYCLDTNKMQNGECPVILWDNQEGYGFTAADNFLDYLIESLEEAKENWDEDEEDW
ncbi:SMI1/KNR4 family protein [Peribacillus frigoritolerans]|uniref:SMI1/KNR4 family protein n=1 Tax=Peribacillus frigoritolerans TaxID=450367 RepID=UPI0022302E1C|nr:SMI1/KNR4 family protein [Peribacillus frigoritolerans]MDM5312627.1 SMI1/KNR4 family protein [Peribacillus frigoritolerans]UZD46007.1 SMI1/KNR4 family protein [Peribacillus frigoritolerans]